MPQINSENLSLTFTPPNFIEAIYWWICLPRYPLRDCLKKRPIVFLRREISKVIPIFGQKKNKTYFFVQYVEREPVYSREFSGFFLTEKVPKLLLDSLEKPYSRVEYMKYVVWRNLRAFPYSIFLSIVPVMYLTSLTGELIGKAVFNSDWGRSISGLSACDPDCLKISADHYRQFWKGTIWIVTFILAPFPLSLLFRRMTRNLNLRNWFVFEATIIVAGIGLPLLIERRANMLNSLSTAWGFFLHLKN